MVYGFAKQSGGHVKIYSEVGHGTTVRLYLPRASADRQCVEVRPCEPAAVDPGDATILVVEDSTEVRRVAVNHLTAFAYPAVEAASGREALNQLAADDSFAIPFTAVLMPGGLSGPQLAPPAPELPPYLHV